MHNRIKITILTITIIITACAQASSLYETIAKENLKSYPPRQHSNFEFHSLSEWMNAELKWQEDPNQFFKGTSRELALEILKQYEKNHPIQMHDVLDKLTIKDLTLICGTDTKPEAHLLSHIDRSSTELGSATLAAMLINPIYCLNELRNRQALIHELLANEIVFNQLDITLKNLTQHQNLFYSFWSEHDGFKSVALQTKIKIPWFENLADTLNTNEYAMEVTERLREGGEIFGITTSAAATVLLPIIGLLKLAGKFDRATLIADWARDHMYINNAVSIFSALGLTSLILKTLWNNRVTQATNDGFSAMQYGQYAYYSFDGIKGSSACAYGIQKKLIAVSQFVQAFKTCDQLVQSNKDLQTSLQHAFELHKLMTDPTYCPDFHTLIDLLSTSTFQGEASIFSRVGRLLAAFSLINKDEVKNAIAVGCAALGEIDAYMSAARLFKEGGTQKNRWCFVEYNDPQPEYFMAKTGQQKSWVNTTETWSNCYTHQINGPTIELHHFWNPHLSAEKAVANSITIGTEHNPRTMIVTGPNAGGKSTIVIKGIPLCAILAQSLGIVPATTARMTIFKNIIGYMNIVDDVAAGNSHFKAGVLRAQDVFSTVERLHNDEFVLIGLDEVFDGTSYTESEIAAKTMVELLGNNPRTIVLSATHFPLMTQLEDVQPKHFKNYKVSVDYNAQGRVIPRFTLEEGISNQHVAFDIIKQEGFSTSFLQRAAAEVAHR